MVLLGFLPVLQTSNLGVRGSNPFRRASIRLYGLNFLHQYDFPLPDGWAVEAIRKHKRDLNQNFFLNLGGKGPRGGIWTSSHPHAGLFPGTHLLCSSRKTHCNFHVTIEPRHYKTSFQKILGTQKPRCNFDVT